MKISHDLARRALHRLVLVAFGVLSLTGAVPVEAWQLRQAPLMTPLPMEPGKKFFRLASPDQ